MAETPPPTSSGSKPSDTSDDADAGLEPMAQKARGAQAAPRPAPNTVKPRRPRQKRAPRERPQPLEPEKPATAAPGAQLSRPTAASPTDTDEDAVPQSVRDRFVQDRDRYYFPDGSLAFRDLGRRLTTPSENTVVIQGLVEIAGSRGWHEITVRGSERFRQEAWRQARLSGLSVQGHRPTEAEQAALVRAMAARRNAPEREPAEAPPAPTAAAAQPEAQKPRSSSAAESRIEGRLLVHGRDGYQHDSKQSPSYYVRIQTPQGPREVWGQDLERAILKSFTQPQIGDEIVLQTVGRDPVTVRRSERDDQGTVKSSREIAVHRNRWVIERPEFFEERAREASLVRDARYDPKEVVREHPSLAGTYVTLRAGALAAQQLRNSEDRRRFVALLRDALAEEIERGAPLRSIRVRDRTRTTEQRERDERTAGRGFSR